MRKLVNICRIILLQIFILLKRFFCAILKQFSVVEKFQIGFSYGSFQPFSRLYLKIWGINVGKHIYLYEIPYVYKMNNLRIGDYSSLGEFTKIWNFAPIVIGNDFMAAAGLQILTGGHDADTLEPFAESVSIGNRVWCGANVTILPGVTIGDNVVIGAGSIVNKDLASNGVYAGTPARFIRDVDLEKRERANWSQRTIIKERSEKKK